jgi:hypothetical protein
MAIGDAYATAAIYRDVIEKTDAGEDAEVLDDLKAVTRYIEKVLSAFFGDTGSLTWTWDTYGGTRFYAPRPWAFKNDTPTVKVDLAGDFSPSTVLAKDTDFWFGPWEAASLPEAEPYSFLQLIPTSAILSNWPTQMRAIEVTGNLGWPAIPKALERATIHLTAILRLETPRATEQIPQGIEAAVRLSAPAQNIVRQLMEAYRRAPGDF